jgi:trimeric autotransporter adhesin
MSKIRSAASVMFCLLLVAITSSCGTSHSGPTLTGIDINPISPTIRISTHDTQQFTATGHFSDGSTASLTTNANWSSDNTAVATIQNLGTQPGLATGKSVGTANITVSFAQGSSTVNASTDLTVDK